eukprot:m.93782 g.93782  ORF g.93782 m.93782 type:complete len:297 (-) comp12399_c0_seq1:785-1675(-)
MAVVVVCGLPGSGKSYLSSLLMAYCSQQQQPLTTSSELKGFEWERVDFDDICAPVSPSSQENNNIGGRECDEIPWKLKRRRAIAIVEQLISTNLKKRVVVVVDDTFHLRSMRRELYQIARECEVGFGVIHVQTDVKSCVARDALRTTTVGKDAIERMQATFEEPRERWEVNNLLIVNNSNDSDDGALIEMCMQFVDGCTATPLSSFSAEQRLKEKEQQRTAEDAKHQTELALREKIRSIMADPSTSNFSRVKKQKLAKGLGQLKKRLRQNVEDGALALDEALKKLDDWAEEEGKGL